MRNDAYEIAGSAAAREGVPPFESQPLPVRGRRDANARDAILPVADATYERPVAMSDATTSNAPLYVSVRFKFAGALVVSLGWLGLSIAVALPWMTALATLVGHVPAIAIVA